VADVLILGDGEEERAWCAWFSRREDDRLAVIYPGPAAEAAAEVPVAGDLDEALASPGIELTVVGGPPTFRAEALRRAAAEGMAIICLHPPGEDSEAYYQVAMSRSETGAVVVPDLPLRLHPGLDRLRQALASGELGGFRNLRYEGPQLVPGEDLARATFARMVDVVRALLGEIEAVTASGDPAGTRPDVELVVQLRASGGRRAEIRAWSGPPEPSRLTLNGTLGSLSLEFDPWFHEPGRLVKRLSGPSDPEITALEPWDPRAEIVRVLRAASGRRAGEQEPSVSPSLADGTRATEVAEAVVRSLRKGRTIDLHYEAITEESSFKSFMTSTGCLILLSILVVLPIAMAGPALGLPWLRYLVYGITPLLVIFATLQILRFGIRREGPPATDDESSGKSASIEE
jgi:myo-inositol 2-dehydrogenase/D-chiro-inositol 1-dehydrogenase